LWVLFEFCLYEGDNGCIGWPIGGHFKSGAKHNKEC